MASAVKRYLGRPFALAILVALAGCTPAPSGSGSTGSVETSKPPAVSTVLPSQRAEPFPVGAFRAFYAGQILSPATVDGRDAERFQASLVAVRGPGVLATLTISSPRRSSR